MEALNLCVGSIVKQFRHALTPRQEVGQWVLKPAGNVLGNGRARSASKTPILSTTQRHN